MLCECVFIFSPCSPGFNRFTPFAVIEEPIMPVAKASDWVVQKAKSFCHIVGLSCEGFEGELLALLTAIEVSRTQNGTTSPFSPLTKSRNRRHRELTRLACTVNYDGKGDQSNRGKRQGKGSSVFSMPKILSWKVLGLNERDKRLRVKNLLREWKADIVNYWSMCLELLYAVYGVVIM
jgi:hypothetical protein